MTSTLPTITHRSATVSECGKYRYSLERRWNDAGIKAAHVRWIMLNPSTADANIDDATIRRCIGFSNAWHFSSMVVMNLYAYRATNPRELSQLSYAERCGPENGVYLCGFKLMPEPPCFTVLAWGDGLIDRAPPIIESGRCYALGYTKKANPKHPLYLPAGTPLFSYPA